MPRVYRAVRGQTYNSYYRESTSRFAVLPRLYATVRGQQGKAVDGFK